MQSEFGLEVMRQINRMTEDEWPAYFEQLRLSRRLHAAICEINLLLREPLIRDDAMAALKRVGLAAGG